MQKILYVIKTSCLLLLLFAGLPLCGQGRGLIENSFESNWNLTLQIGRTALISEVTTDFKGNIIDMNNLSDWGFNLHFAKMIYNGLDFGIEFGKSKLKGYNNNPSNINLLMLHSDFHNNISEFQAYPIIYDSDYTNFSFFTKYNFRNFSTWSLGYIKMNIYLKIGAGIAFPTVELNYREFSNYEFTGLKHPLYLKGRYPLPVKDSHSYISTALGINYQLNERVFFSIESSTQLIGADYLDGIHNYNNLLTPATPNNKLKEYRVPVYGLAARILFGICYNFNFDTHRQLREKYLPWYSLRSGLYYSKYQNSTTKKDRQERLPFYNENFKIKKQN